MRKLEIIALMGGLASALVWAFIGLLLLNRFTAWPYQHMEHGSLVACVFLFLYGCSSPLMIRSDIRHFYANGRTLRMQPWNDHFGYRLTLFVLHHRVLFYAALVIPLVFFFLRVIASAAYRVNDTMLVPTGRWFSNALDWIEDRFEDLRYALRWH